jgi:hypothetical protein
VPGDPKLAKWDRWIRGPIWVDCGRMQLRRSIWDAVIKMVKNNPKLREMDSDYWGFHHGNYGDAQAMAVRRQTDKDPNARSLARLLIEMSENPELITREYVAQLDVDFDLAGDQLDPKVPCSDLDELSRDAKAITDYVNKRLAHDDRRNVNAAPPEFGELHAAIDSVWKIFERYAKLAGLHVLKEPKEESDWRAIFRLAWLAGDG